MHPNMNSFGKIDLDEDVEPEPETIPMPGSAHLVVKDVCMPLFTSAEWVIVGKVGEHELGRSTVSAKPHSDAHIKRWTRSLVRQNKARLRRLGVDVPDTYSSWGGLLEDLDD